MSKLKESQRKAFFAKINQGNKMTKDTKYVEGTVKFSILDPSIRITGGYKRETFSEDPKLFMAKKKAKRLNIR